MKKIAVFICLIISCVLFAQEDAWVYFKDKPDYQTYLNNPLSILTQRALDRRTKQSIALDVSDVPVNQTYIDQIIASNGITVKAKSKWLNCLHIRGSVANINALKSLSFVSKIEFANLSLNGNSNKTIHKKRTQPQPKVSKSKVSFNYGASSNQISMLNGHLLHAMNYTGSGKIIAVLDDGFNQVNTANVFKRLRDNNSILGGYNYVAKTSNVYSNGNHGTEVLSLMGGFQDGSLVGTAPDASYYLYITEDNASENPVEESNWVEAAEEADRVGADIITSSLGYYDFDNSAYNHTYSQMTGNIAFASKGANIAFEKGIVVLASAGNSGANINNPYVAVPAEAKNVIAVGAVQSNKAYASFSSIGPSYDGRVKPDVTAQGKNTTIYSNGTISNFGSGTSFSCPIVAGMVACLYQALPNLSAKEIKKIIIESADNFNEPPTKSRTLFGYGIPNFNLALTKSLGINSFDDNKFIIYPNPTSDIIYFTPLTDSVLNKISIYSLLGQKILELQIPITAPKFSIKSLVSGTYICNIASKESARTVKIIKK